MRDKYDDMAEKANVLVKQISPIFSGQPPEVIGAALADLVAMWLAGHINRSGKTNQLREELLQQHITVVRELTVVNAKIQGTGE